MLGPDTHQVTHIQLTLAIMADILLMVMPIQATDTPIRVTFIRATPIRATVMAMGVRMSGPIGAKADALLGELIGAGTAGIRASASPDGQVRSD